MNILMMTNTFSPHVGGVARSVAAFTEEYRRRGHRVLVVAPVFDNLEEDETDVVRVPAFQHFNGSDFSVVLPLPGFLASTIEKFSPDIVHSHHPFLIGGTALRVAHIHGLPLVFTHHTMYEQYTHYVPVASKALKRFVVKLSTSYANLCDQVFAPSRSVAALLRERGVTTRIDEVPTGVCLDRFSRGSGTGFRAALDIPADALVIGHLGRLAPEKNLDFLARAVASFLTRNHQAHFLVVGKGPSEKVIRRVFAGQGLSSRLHLVGILDLSLLASSYRAMDLFVFASKSETQGLVLAEAMAAGVPVVALDAAGVREVVRDQKNGRLLAEENVAEFSSALAWFAGLSIEQRKILALAARETAGAFAMERLADKALALYEQLREKKFVRRPGDYTRWTWIQRRIRTEWNVLKEVAGAAGAVVNVHQDQKSDSGRR